MNQIKFTKIGRYATPTKPWIPPVTIVGSGSTQPPLDSVESPTFNLDDIVEVNIFDDSFVQFMVKIGAAEVIEVKSQVNPTKGDKKKAEVDHAKGDKKKAEVDHAKGDKK